MQKVLVLIYSCCYYYSCILVVLWPTLKKNDYYKFDLITLVTFVCFATEKKTYEITPKQFISAIFLFAALVYNCGREGEKYICGIFFAL